MATSKPALPRTVSPWSIVAGSEIGSGPTIANVFRSLGNGAGLVGGVPSSTAQHAIAAFYTCMDFGDTCAAAAMGFPIRPIGSTKATAHSVGRTVSVFGLAANLAGHVFRHVQRRCTGGPMIAWSARSLSPTQSRMMPRRGCSRACNAPFSLDQEGFGDDEEPDSQEVANTTLGGCLRVRGTRC